MKLKLLACKVLFRELSLLASQSPHFVDTTYLKQEYHNTPEALKEQLQAEINAIEGEQSPYSTPTAFDAILLGYGLCSNAVLGLKTKRTPLIIPKAHDCITLFLGSKERYKTFFDAHDGGVYWYTPGWIENCPMPSEEKYQATYQDYLEKYGEDNAEYLMALEQDWLTKYQTCAFVDWKELNTEAHKVYTAQCAHYLKWKFESLEGSSSLLKKFVDGEWDEQDFLVVPPGHTVEATFDKEILKVTTSN